MFMSKIVNWILGKQVFCLLYHVFASSNFWSILQLIRIPKSLWKTKQIIFWNIKGNFNVGFVNNVPLLLDLFVAHFMW